MTKMNANAKHMKQTARKSNKGLIVAVALAGVLAQVAGTTSATKTAAAKQSEAKPETGKAETKKASATKKSETKPTEKSSAKKAEAKKEVAKPAVKKAEAKPAAKQTAKKTEEKPAAKPAAKTAEAKPASKPTTKKAEAKPATKKAEAKPAAKSATKSAAQQVQKQAPKQAEAKSDCGLQAKISREECIRKACAHVGAGGQAKGPALNVTARQVTGGGTVYYVVELDLGDVHYAVQVDAIDGGVISADQVHAGTRTLLDEQGNPVEGTEQPADDVQTVKKANSATPATPTETKKVEEAKPEAPKAEAPKAEETKPEEAKSEKAKTEGAKQADAAKTNANKGNGLQAQISRDECIKKACAHVGAGGQAKGPAKNVTAKQVTGGGTVYYVVELDLGDVHYSVQVDAIDGSIISADQVHAGKRVLLDKQANPVEGTEQEA